MTMPAGWKKPTEQTVLGKESSLWYNEITEGFFKKKVVGKQIITNYRVIYNNSEIMLKNIDDILVMNQHRVSQSNYMGTSARGRL
jgi:hypothetical protein